MLIFLACKFFKIPFRPITHTRKAKAASGRLSFKQGYNQTCQWYHNLWAAMSELHVKFHQNPWCRFGEKRGQDTDNV